jgi:hypothetical protein
MVKQEGNLTVQRQVFRLHGTIGSELIVYQR